MAAAKPVQSILVNSWWPWGFIDFPKFFRTDRISFDLLLLERPAVVGRHFKATVSSKMSLTKEFMMDTTFLEEMPVSWWT